MCNTSIKLNVLYNYSHIKYRYVLIGPFFLAELLPPFISLPLLSSWREKER